MSEKNSDVDRAIAFVGGTALPYQSFGPYVLRPRTAAGARPFIYNEFGEPEYAPQAALAPAPIAPAAAPPAMASIDPIYDALPVVQPPVNRPATMAPPIPQPRMAPRMSTLPQQPVATPMAPPPMQPAPMPAASMYASPVQPTSPYPPSPYPPAPPPMAAAPAPPPPPIPAPPPPPPFFPLLAAALPNATEPAYTPHYPAAAPSEPAYAAVPSSGAGGQEQRSQDHRPQDHRSLADMFTLLAGRAAAVPNQVPTAASLGLQSQASAPAEGQALFRRI